MKKLLPPLVAVSAIAVSISAVWIWRSSSAGDALRKAAENQPASGPGAGNSGQTLGARRIAQPNYGRNSALSLESIFREISTSNDEEAKIRVEAIKLAYSDFDGAMKLLERDAKQTKIDERQREVMRFLAMQNLAFLEMALKRIADPKAGKRFSDPVLAGWARRDPLALRDHFGPQPPSELRNDALLQAVEHGSGNETDAMETLALLPESPQRRDAMRRIAAQVVKNSLEKGIAWASQQKDPLDKEAGEIAVAFRLVENAELDRMTDYANTASSSQVRGHLVNAIAKQLAHTDPEEGRTWLKGVPPEFQARAQINFAVALAEVDPAAGTSEALQLDPLYHHKALVGIVNVMLNKDLPAAGAWVESLPSENGANFASLVANRWASKDPAKAAAWVNAIQDPKLRQLALQGIR